MVNLSATIPVKLVSLGAIVSSFLLAWVKRFAPFLGIAFFIIAGTIIYFELKHFTYHDFVYSISNTPTTIIWIGVVLTLVNYLTLSGYDFLALKYLDKKIPYKRVVLASLVGFSISNNTGHALIAGPSARYRFYSQSGLSVFELMKLSVFNSSMYLLGALTLAPIFYYFVPHLDNTQSAMYHVIQVVMVSALIGLAAYWSLIFFKKAPFTIKGISFNLPSPKMTLLQTLVASIDLIFASLILYLFLQHSADISFATFLVIFLVAQVVGLYSQVPGGVGVFEGVFMYMMGDAIPSHDLFAGLILFRIIYYFIPLLLAGATMLSFEYLQHHQHIKDKTMRLVRVVDGSVLRIFSYILFFTGAILLFSTATPISQQAMAWVKTTLPLPLFEASHLLTSIVGMLLILVSRAIRQRINAAYYMSLLLLGLGIGLSLLLGWDWKTALILTTVFLLLLPTKSFFNRPSRLIDTAYSRSWYVLIILVLCAALWLGLFSYKHVDYQNTLWWQFSYQAEASRFLRGFFIGICVISLLLIHRLFSSPSVKMDFPSEAELDEAQKLVHASSRETNNHLALLGDKHFLWSADRSAFLMFGVTKKHWVVMGEPVGNLAHHEMLLWNLREAADAKGAKLVCYQVSKHNLAVYLDMGLVLIKFGEEGKVDLSAFGLEGSARSGIRQTYNKLKKLAGISFEVLDVEAVKDHLLELKDVSDNWMDKQKGPEKRFSLGFFAKEYIVRTPVAIVKREGEIIAFANLWQLDNKHELSIDLMRYREDAPGSIMEWLTIQIMLWGKEQGYQHFNLGMAPLSGLETRELASLWHKIGHIIFEHGGDFYNFGGLHAYKDKFKPLWEARYVAVPNNLGIVPSLLSVTKLISGGSLGQSLKK